MIQKHFEDIIRKKFGYDFSPTQQIAVEHFIRFFFAANFYRNVVASILKKWLNEKENMH